MQLLAQSAATTIILGPFVDSTDGYTAETALTISQADIRLSKNGGAFAQTNNAAGATHMENGYYSVPLDATDTNTLGRITVAVSESGALPVYREYMIVPANAYDSLVAGSDTLEADLTQMGGVAQSATDLKDFADSGYDPAVHKVETVKTADACTTNSDMRGTDNAALASVCTETRLAELDGANLPTDVSNVKGDTAAILDDTGTSGVIVATSNDKTGYALSAAGVQAIWDALTSALTTVGSIGKKLADWVLGTDSKALVSTDAQDLSGTLDVNAKTVGDKTGYSISGTKTTLDALNDIAAADVLAGTVEGALTLAQVQKIILAFAAGAVSGGGTTTITFLSQDGLTSRIVMTVDASGNRSAVVVDGT